MNKYIISIAFTFFLFSADLCAQNNPLEKLSFYMGTWRLADDDPFILKNPRYKSLKVIDFRWAANERIIRSRTGMFSEEDSVLFSEGIITYNPTSNKLIWLEFQLDGNLLFEGEYTILDDNKVSREYTVHYSENTRSIPHPEVP